MYKKISFSLILVGLFFLFSLTPVRAQENTVSVWNCLSARKDGINKIKLFQKNLNQYGQVYIVDCIGTPQGSYCTTGNKEDDTKLAIGFNDPESPFTLDNPAALKDKTTSEFTATVDFSKAPLHTFYYVYFDAIDSNKTIKYSGINFVGNVCANTVLAIPDYRFFDMASLEPLSNIRITLTDDNGTSMVPSQVTRADGAYYYAHENPDLKFKLEVDNSYSFATQVPQSTIQRYQSNFEHYIRNVYTDKDVPLVPMGSPRIKPTEAVFYTVDRFEKYTRVQGRLSIPYSIVTFSQGGVEVQRVKADKYGDYSANIDNELIDTEKVLEMEYVKANLLSAHAGEAIDLKSFYDSIQSLIEEIKNSTAKPSTLGILGPDIVPISSEIEGYAVDNAGNIIPEGIIQVILKTSDKVYYEVKANKDGYFKITAGRLPKFEYFITSSVSEASVSLYNYSDKNVQSQLLAKMEASTKQKFNLAIAKELLSRTTYIQTPNIFKNEDAATIAKKKDVVANQRAVSLYYIKSIVDKGEVGKLFGTDINQISKTDFEARLQRDLTVVFENRDNQFASEFSQYFTNLAYSQELVGYFSANNKSVFIDKMTEHFISDIFHGDKLLAQNTTDNPKSIRVLAATVAPVVFNETYFEGKIIGSVGNLLGKVVNNSGNVDLGKALAQTGKNLAKSIIGDVIKNEVKDPIASGLLNSAVGAIISGGDVGKALTNTARSMLISQGSKMLTQVLTNPIKDNLGVVTNRGLSGSVAAPIVGFVSSFIRTGDIGAAAKSAVMGWVQQGISNLVKDFIGQAFGFTFGSLNAFWGAIASTGVGLIVAMIMSLLMKSSGGGS